MAPQRFSLALVLVVLILGAGGSAARAQSVTRPTFRVLQRVQKMMEEERHAEARSELEKLVVATTDNSYDFALANQYLAHASVLLDDMDRARSALEAALGRSGLPDDLRRDMNLFYGTVLLGAEEYELARRALEEWYALVEAPKPGQIFSLAYASYMSGRVARAEPLIARAIQQAPQPPDPWYQLQYRVLFDQKKYARAEAVLRGMISRTPANDAHWRALASHYLQLEKSDEALAAVMVAYLNGLVSDPAYLKQLVSLYGYAEIPERGARLLADLLKRETLERDPETLKQLGNLWLLARERQKAIAVLAQAAKLEADGRTYELLGGVYFEEEEWANAYSAYRDALRMGGLEEPRRVSLLAGISAFRAGRKDDARESLEVAAESEDLRSQAESLLRQLDPR